MKFDEAMDLASRNESFMATVYAMNTLLINKGVYSRQEFQVLFTEWVVKEERKKKRNHQTGAVADRSNAPDL